MSSEPSIFNVKWLLFTVGFSAICILVTWFFLTSPTNAPPSTSPTSTGGSTPTTTSASPSNQTIAVTLPPNSHYSGTLSVAIPDHIIDKLRPPSDSGAAKIIENIWPGVAALLGALAGAALTYMANSQKNKQDKTMSEQGRQQAIADRTETRRQAIRDLSRADSLEVMKAGRQVAAATRTLWVDVANEAAPERVKESETKLGLVIRDWYSASEALLLTVPPMAETAFKEYRIALNEYLLSATRWSGVYLAGKAKDTPSGTAPHSAVVTNTALQDTDDERSKQPHSSAKCKRLEQDVLDRRDDFIQVLKKHFHEGAWSNT